MKYTKSLVRQSDQIAVTIRELAVQSKVPLNRIDFSIQKTITEIKMPEASSFEELTSANSGHLTNPRMLSDPDFQIRQLHQVTFRVTSEPSSLLKVEVSSNKSRTKAYATILPSSTIKDSQNLREFIINELNKIKLRHQMIINLNEGTFRSDVETLANRIRVHNGVKEQFRVQLCEWLAPIPTVDDELIFHYKNKKAPKEHERIDYADRGFVNAVEAGNLLVEYIKPKSGIDGRDFRGYHIPTKEPKHQFSPVLSVDSESVQVVEDADSIKYYALKKGYVSYHRDSLSVGEVLEVESIDFKHTGDIKAGTDKDIKILIRNKESDDDSIDSIGANSKVEVSELDISGSVASGATINAQKVNIKGQTHATSKITTKTAHIGVLKGSLECETAVIERIEHGRVNAKEVTVRQVIGGFISARVIKIKSLYSHATLVASSRVEIGSVEHGENRVFIEAAAYNEDKKRIKELINQRNELVKSKAEAARKFKSKQELLIRNKTQAEQIKQRIDNEKKAGRVVPSIFMDRYMRYLDAIEETKALGRSVSEINKKIAITEDEIDAIQNTVFDAVVINHSNYVGYNEIKFRLINPLKEISFVPNDGQKIHEIKLIQTGLEDYDIRIFE